MDPFSDLVMQTMASPLVYPVLFALIVIDGFFPPVPSESVVVAAAAVAAATGTPNLWVLIGVAAVGAAVGDNIAYLIGRKIGTDRFAWMRRPRVAAAVTRAGRGLDHRAGVVILTARYIPIGRLAVNMTAGATGLSWRRFWPLTVLGGASWSVYSVAVGLLAGHWARSQPLIAAAVGIGIAISLGIIIDRVSGWLRRRRDRRHARSAALRPVSHAMAPHGAAE